MAPKRAAALPQPSASSSEATSASSSDEAGDEEVEARRPSSPPKQKPTQKSSTASLSSIPQPPKPVVKPSQNLPPTAAASSDEEEDDEDDADQDENGGEDGSSSEESDSEDARTKKQAPPPPPSPVRPPTKPQPQSPLPLPLPKPTPPKPSSDSGSSDGSDSGSDSSEEDAVPASAPRPSRATDPSIKPINTKPMDGPNRSAKLAVSPAPAPGQDSRKRKRDDNGGQNRQLFQRLWSLDDEVTLLNGVVEYRLKNGTLPSRASGMDAVRDRIKDSLQMEVTSSQLVTKLRGLKKKFQTNVARQKNGTGPSFTKRQEQDAFELSKKLWGVDKVGAEDVGASHVSDDNVLSDRETKVNLKRKEGNLKPFDVSKLSNGINKKNKGTETGKSQYPLLWETVTVMADENKCGLAIKRALEMLDDAKANLMEEKLKKLRITQVKQQVRRADLDKETLKLIYDAITRSMKFL